MKQTAHNQPAHGASRNGVATASDARQWISRTISEAKATSLAPALQVHPLIARLLVGRGLDVREAASDFLRPSLKRLSDPFAIAGVSAAVDRLMQAIEREEDVLIFGDYDVDGVTSTVLLTSILQEFGLKPRYVVPRRMDEGYGLSEAAVERAMENGCPGLFIALDCGTNSRPIVDKLRTGGCEVLIIDHHQSTEALPEAVLVNPHVDGTSPESAKFFCTVGLVFKVVHGLVKRLREQGDATAEALMLRDYLDLVALGTVADLVPLKGENRILVRFGLRTAHRSRRCGLHALFEVSGLDPAQALFASDIAFRIGPRINASGRIAEATLPIELLLTEDTVEAGRIARQLDAMNQERQTLEREASSAAEAMVMEDPGAPGIVVHHADWHPGVVGIVAGKLARQFHRPAIVMGGDDSDAAHGSARSISGVNLLELLKHCDPALESWGGHPMAAGVSTKVDRVPELRERFNQAIREQYPNGFPAPQLTIDAWMAAEDLTSALFEEINALRPFGQENPEPILGVRGVTLTRPPNIFGRGHCRFYLKGGDGQLLSCLGWGHGERPPPTGRPVELALKLGWNCFRGEVSPQATMIDWR
ncbi:MAG: single-stranded-DNA-specific exonuclease RecJ [Verrucomicrobiota bacterium]